MAAANDAAVAKNGIRASIAALFPVRDSFTLVRPMNDEKALQQLSSLPPDSLREEFTAGVKGLLDRVFANAGIKAVGGAELTGPLLAGLAATYVEAINDGAVPTIATAWQSVAEAECRRASDAGAAAYHAAWPQLVPSEEAELTAAHLVALEAARSEFVRLAVGDAHARAVHEAKMIDHLTAAHLAAKRAVFAEAAAAVTEVLATASVRLRSAAGAADASVEGLVAVAEEEATAVEMAASGPTKWPKLAAWWSTEAVPLVAALAARRVDEADSRAETAEQAAEAAASSATTARMEAAESKARQAKAEAAEAAAREDERLARVHAAQSAQAAATAEARSQAAEALAREAAAVAEEATGRAAAAEGAAQAQRAVNEHVTEQLTAARQEATALAAEVEATEARRHSEAQRATAAEAQAASVEATVRQLQAQLAREQAAVAAAAHREAALQRKVEAGRLKGASFDSKLSAMQREAHKAAMDAASRCSGGGARRNENLPLNVLMQLDVDDGNKGREGRSPLSPREA